MSKILPQRGCVYCLKLFHPKRAWQRFCGSSCRKIANNEELLTEYTCEYCGLVGDTIDHVPPSSIRPALVTLGLDAEYPFITVRACRECNSALSDQAYWTIESRRDYIAKWIENRYRKYLEIPHWAKDELEALEYGLRKLTMHGIAVRELTILRLHHARSDKSSPLATSEFARIEAEKDKRPNKLCLLCNERSYYDEYCSDTCEYLCTGSADCQLNVTFSEMRRVFRTLPKTKRLELHVNLCELKLKSRRRK